MSHQKQKTLAQPVEISGTGLHSGRPVRIVIRPAKAGRGLLFRRADLPGQPEIAADFRSVHSTQLATTLGRSPVSVATVEHLLAAFQLLEIDNAIVDVFGPELPILDGSSRVFCEEIQRAGVETQNADRRVLVIRKKIELKIQEKWARVEPSAHLEVHGSIEFDHPMIGYQEFHYRAGTTAAADLAPARTFGFLRDIELLHKAGLARGGSLENAVVVNETGILNPEGLRFTNEFARHKVLDALGDFKLAGISLCGHFRLHRAGHDLHAKLLEAIFSDPSNYEIIEPSSESSDSSSERASSLGALGLAARVAASF